MLIAAVLEELGEKGHSVDHDIQSLLRESSQ